MRIAYLSTFFPFRGGIRQFNENLAAALINQGHQVDCYTFTRQYPNLFFPGSSQFSDDKTDASGLNAKAVLDSINPLSWRKTAQLIAKSRPDVLLMKFWLPFFGPSLGTVAGTLKKQGCRVITILDNAKPHENRPGDKAFTHYFLRRNSGFVAMSDTVEQDLKDLAPLAKYTRLVHPLYDHYGQPLQKAEAAGKLGLDPNKKTLLYFGFIREYKGIDLLLDAFAQLDESYQLIIAGEPYIDWSPYEAQLAKNPNKERVLPLIRYIKGEEIPALFSMADLLVLPYKAATQSGVLTMAAHYDLPVLATEVGSLPEMIQTLNCGRTVPPNNTQALGDAIAAMFRGSVRTDLLKGIQKSKSTYTWDYFAQGIVDFTASV